MRGYDELAANEKTGRSWSGKGYDMFSVMVVSVMGLFAPQSLPDFVQEMHQGFAVSYRGPHASWYPKAQELGWGETTVVTDDVKCPQKQAYWYAYRDGNGILKLVFQYRMRTDFAVELALPNRLVWTSSEVCAITRDGESVWAREAEGFTIMNANSPAVTLESMLEELSSYAVIVNQRINLL